MSPQLAVVELWAVWVVSWFAAAFWSGRTETRPALGEEWLYRIVTTVGAVLLFGVFTRSYGGPYRYWDVGETGGWALVGAAALGFLFAWWARLHLGRLWSGWVTKKAGHRVVDTGPYALVRHPIYTGILLAAFATAILRGTLAAVAGAAIMSLGFWIKARLEERFLREQLGAEAYDSYRRRVPMLVPFGPKSS